MYDYRQTVNSRKFINKAIEIVGSRAKLARLIGSGCVYQKIYDWLHRNKEVPPAEYAIPIEKATNGIVKRYELRPDLYTEDKV